MLASFSMVEAPTRSLGHRRNALRFRLRASPALLSRRGLSCGPTGEPSRIFGLTLPTNPAYEGGATRPHRPPRRGLHSPVSHLAAPPSMAHSTAPVPKPDRDPNPILNTLVHIPLQPSIHVDTIPPADVTSCTPMNSCKDPKDWIRNPVLYCPSRILILLKKAWFCFTCGTPQSRSFLHPALNRRAEAFGSYLNEHPLLRMRLWTGGLDIVDCGS